MARRRLRDITIDTTPLKIREYRLLWTGSTISSMGSTITRIALPWQVYHITGSTLWVGILGGLALFPYVAGGVIGGAIADAYDRRRIARIVAVCSASCSALLALNAATHPRIWAIFVLAVTQTAFQAVGAPAARSAVPLLVPRELIPSAAALTSISYSTAFVVGPAVGGVLLGAFGATVAYLVDLGSFVAPLITWTAMKPIPPVVGDTKASRSTILDGLHVLRGRPVLVASFLADLDAMIFGMPTALFPAVADQRFPHQGYAFGLIAAAPFAGAMVASLTSGWCRRISRQGRAVCICVVVWGIGIVAFGLVDGLALTLGTLAVAGAADMISGVFRQSIMQTAAPREMLGRMEGVGMAVWTSGPALGDLEAGGVAALTSVNASIVIGGVACIAGIGAMAAALPSFVRYRIDRDAVGVDPAAAQPAAAVDPAAGAAVAPDPEVGADARGANS
jgi:MFS family permease